MNKERSFEKNKTNPIFKMFAEIQSEVPPEEWQKLPSDLAKNVDRYLYGVPKQK